MNVEQFWFGKGFPRLFGVLRSPDTSTGDRGVVFFPGLAETKAGPAFLFTRMAQCLSTTMPALQFDYGYWGDSEGDAEDCTLEGMFSDACQAIDELQQRTGCQQLIFIGNGIGNWIAARMGQLYTRSMLLLILPYHTPLSLETINKSATFIMTSTGHVFMDTGKSGQWERGEAAHIFFKLLGTATQGLVIRQQFIEDLAAIDAELLLSEYHGRMLEVYAYDKQPLGLVTHQQSIALPYKDNLGNPRNCDFLFHQAIAWIQQTDEGNK